MPSIIIKTNKIVKSNLKTFILGKPVYLLTIMYIAAIIRSNPHKTLLIFLFSFIVTSFPCWIINVIFVLLICLLMVCNNSVIQIHACGCQ